MNQNILVTGGAGFIGSNFIHYLLNVDSNVRVINLDALTYAGSLENLSDMPDPSRHVFIHGDIANRELVNSIFEKYDISIVVHFAAESHVDRSIFDPGTFVRTNIIGTFTLLEAARKAWIEEKRFSLPEVRFHHVSTDEVFGTLAPGETAFEEKTPYAPRSPYAASKAASDHLVRAYHTTYGLPITISNCSNNYGPRQFPEKLIPLMILNAREGKPLPIYGDGMQIRDWLYVVDHCQAIHRILVEGNVGETYCIGGDNQPFNVDVVRLICRILDERYPESPFTPHAQLMTHVDDRPGHDRRYDINIAKITAELGWEPGYSLEDGMRMTVAWYLEHPDWVQTIRSKQNYTEWLEKNYQGRKIVE